MWFRSLCLDDAPADGSGAVPTIKIKQGDSEIEVPKPAGVFTADEVKAKYVPLATHNFEMGRMRKELDGFKGHRNPTELLEDAEFRTAAMQAWGLEPGKTQAQFQEQLKRQGDEFRAREVEPRERKITDLVKKVESYRNKSLDSQILSGAIDLVDEKYLKPMTNGGKPLIVSLIRDGFAYDEQTDEWYAKGSNGSPFAFSQSGETPYMTAREFLVGWVNTDGKDFAKSQRQEGAESQPSVGMPGQVGNELRLTESQIRDIPFFKKQQARADKEGLKIVPIPG